ncbi:MAG: NAD(P)H-hydrate dehydratase, partial [Verrucomicrobiota bacterium]
MQGVHPILTCEQAREFETGLFASDETREWAAMTRAGRALADAALRDMAEIGGFPREGGRVLVLAGKGHNAGDALIAAGRIAETNTNVRVDVLFAFGSRALRPLAARAWRDLAPRATVVDAPDPAGHDLVLEGVFGFQFRPPLPAAVADLLRMVNALPVRMRVAVDLPAGLDAPDAFRADFTYATGIVKPPLLADLPAAGRPRYLDLGFFPPAAQTKCHSLSDTSPAAPSGDRAKCHLMSDTLPGADGVLTPGVLAPLAGWRDPRADKRTFGHVFIVGGSRAFPGAVLLNVLAALRSGAGLVTAFVPESLAAAFAARAPEAMWVGWPETPDGGLALEGEHLLRERLARCSALLIGSGLGREPETLAMVRSVVSLVETPLVLDADALQAEIVAAGQAPRILTPHAGEFARIEKMVTDDMVVVRKGPLTRVEHRGARRHSLAGGPVLARGGSGDLLAGLIAG